MVLPGIGGTVLARASDGEVVWNGGLRGIADLLRHPERLSLDEELKPGGLITDLRLVPGWTLIEGYSKLWSRLGRLPGAVPDAGPPGPRVPGANVVAFGYDFRKPIEDSAERLASEVERRLDSLGASGASSRRSAWSSWRTPWAA